MEKLASVVGVKLNTIWRWENEKATPSVDMLKPLSAALHVTEAELLNGPKERKIEINLIFGDMPEKGEIDMSENGNNFDLFMNKNGALGIHGGAMFTSLDDITKFVEDVAEELKKGFEFQKQRGALAAGAD